jgi:hypothetical protein
MKLFAHPNFFSHLLNQSIMKNLISCGIFLAIVGVHIVFAQTGFVTGNNRAYHKFLMPKSTLFIQARSAPLIITETPSVHTTASKTSSELPLFRKSGNSTENSGATTSPSGFDEMGFGSLKINDINIKAVRDFLKNFATVTNNKWLKGDDGSLTCQFSSDGVATSVRYDKSGDRLYIMKIYKEDKLADKIRRNITRKYYGAKITMVMEYDADRGVETYIHLEDSRTYKIVRIVDGDMELYEKLNKG